jgi:superfamily II DNA or RNA helicase
MMAELAIEEVAKGGSVVIYLHRKMLLEQLHRQWQEAGIQHGVLAAGYQSTDAAIQLAMVDTCFARVMSSKRWDLPAATLVIFDEAHQQVGSKALSLVNGVCKDNFESGGHVEAGAFVLGFTATPVNCGRLYDSLLECGRYSELRECKSHLSVRVYSPSEIDTKGLTQKADGDYSAVELETRASKIVGSAYEGWRKLNPDAYPAILFGPTVEGARWFAHDWAAKGVPVAHIDGEVCLVPTVVAGHLRLEQHPASPEIRQEIMDRSRTGKIALVTNRFVLREAIDMPWLYHGICATVFGAESSYLQSVGRIQRYYESYTHKLWQDHGGSYWRHGSPNADRTWRLDDTNRSRAKERLAKIKAAEKPEMVEGIQCPRCDGWRTGGPVCPHCNHQHKRSVRKVVHADGELVLQTGSVTPKAKSSKSADKLWVSTLYAAAHLNRSVSSAVAVWRAKCREQGFAIDSRSVSVAIPAMDSVDYHRSVLQVYPWLRTAITKRGKR